LKHDSFLALFEFRQTPGEAGRRRPTLASVKSVKSVDN
jgi:hypothetical protein